MKLHETQTKKLEDSSPQNSGLRASRAVTRDRGISDVTLWRWARRGWITLVNISGKNYVNLASLAEFDRRAAAGEFAKAPAGAARASSQARKEREAI
jgi:predicted site-specific integrase-resolvase